MTVASNARLSCERSTHREHHTPALEEQRGDPGTSNFESAAIMILLHRMMKFDARDY
jgi:hypothetical protein